MCKAVGRTTSAELPGDPDETSPFAAVGGADTVGAAAAKMGMIRDTFAEGAREGGLEC